MAHYAKRIVETLYVHRFSKGTMPLRNLYRNCAYYWAAGVVVSLAVNYPRAAPHAPLLGAAQAYAALAAFVLAELGNGVAHLRLRALRPAGSTKYVIPHGFPFDTLGVTCPNYTFEVLAWLAFAALTQSLAALVFAALGAYQMAKWADGKHRRMLDMFGRDYPSRKRIVPFVY
mmetsp:Transcript_27449/g.66592  ORF Transcript_27449/g.66592 Transcript_27449/m.66592 type:complete len:173 (+) Transcript_27449:3958-4476(+)